MPQDQDAVEHVRQSRIRLYLFQPVAIVTVFGILALVIFGLHSSTEITASTRGVVTVINSVLWGGLGIWCLKNWVIAMKKGVLRNQNGTTNG